MTTYRLQLHPITNLPDLTLQRVDDATFIPMVQDNQHYLRFKADILTDSAQLEDVHGVAMSAESAKKLIESLP